MGRGEQCSNGEIFRQEIESKLLHHLNIYNMVKNINKIEITKYARMQKKKFVYV